MSAEILINNRFSKTGSRERSPEDSLSDLFDKSAKKRTKKNITKIESKPKSRKQIHRKGVATGTKISSTKVTSAKVTMAEDQKWLFDPWVLIISISIIALGLTMVGSASISIAERNNGEPFFYLYRQLVASGLGLGLGVIVLYTPMKFWQNIGPLFLLIALILLMAVLVPGIGKEINGSSRWIPLGVFNLQVSELAKLAMVIYLAGYLVRHIESVKTTIKGFFMPMLVLSTVSVLLLMEPDLGATVVISATAMGMLFLGGVRLWQFLALMLLMGVSV
ncbi:MAG: FtsW/RodA/SpoVE family cell cycle protein, partial [Gammaproteobacteria bacterium]|nr:FtsW/RodA/SpoVE family cell cycle protein [Gammaproteobacteria bacterium]